MIKLAVAVMTSVLLLIVPPSIGLYVGSSAGFVVGLIIGVILSGGGLLFLIPNWARDNETSSLRELPSQSVDNREEEQKED